MTTPRDEVDAILDGWKTQRPDLDSSPLAVFSRVMRLSRHLDKFRRTAVAAHGLEQWEFEMLTMLRRVGEPYELQPSRFMNELLVPSGTLTHRINLMVERGWAERHQDKADRRVKYVRATQAGIEAADNAMADLLAQQAAMLETMPKEDREELASLLKVLLLGFNPTGPEER